MTPEEIKSKEALLEELESLQQKHAHLKRRLERESASLNSECDLRSRMSESLDMARVIIDNSPVILFRREAGEGAKLVYVSDNVVRLGYAAEEFISGELLWREILHPDDAERVTDEIMGYAESEVEAYTQRYRVVTRKGDVRWIEDRTSVVHNERGEKIYNQGLLEDITERKLAQEALQKSEEKFRRIVSTAAEGFVLMDGNLTITDVNSAYCRLLGYSREELIGRSPHDFASPAFRQFAASRRDELMAQEYRELEGEVVTKDGRTIPVLVHGNVLRDDDGAIIGNMAFITDMSEHKKALALAGEVQKSLLPQDQPDIPGLDIAGKNITCDEIGGDYFDFLWRREKHGGPISIAVGDIAGHGVDAALLMTTARAFLRMRAAQPGSAAQIVTEMNRHLTRDVLESGRFMTLFYLTVDLEGDSVRWVRAGHDPALVYDPAADRFDELKGSGIALGVSEAFTFEENRTTGLKAGKIISLGTDGVWEAFSREGGMFGKERLKRIIRDNAHASAGQIVEAVFGELRRFTDGEKRNDDITLVIVKVTG